MTRAAIPPDQYRRIPDGSRAFAAYRSLMTGGDRQDYRNILRTLRDGDPDARRNTPKRKGRNRR